MPSHSFLRRLRCISFLLLTSVLESTAWLTGSCADAQFPNVIRVDLNPNVFSSNASLVDQRGIYLWVGGQYWRTDYNPTGTTYFPTLVVLSTSRNQTYISTSSSGSQDAPCPSSYKYDELPRNSDSEPIDCCTYNSSYTCHGYYDLTTSIPIYLETSSNFTGSPEYTSTERELQTAGVKYGTTGVYMVLPQTVYPDQNPEYAGQAINRYGPPDQVMGFVDTHEEQVLGLGVNSTFLNSIYRDGAIASRSVGLYFGVPDSAGEDLARNGSLVMGGYSKDRLLGDFAEKTYPIGDWKLARHCPWEVDIAKISSGKEESATEFTACVEPSELEIVLPKAVHDQLSGSSNEITITLTNGLAVEIPSKLASIRAVDDADQSPILGIPFLSQVYLFADYQEKTLSTGLANNTQKYLETFDTLQCIEHPSSMNDLGWAIDPAKEVESSLSSTSSTGLATAVSTAPATSTTSGEAQKTGKPGAASEAPHGEVGFMVLLATLLGFWLA